MASAPVLKYLRREVLEPVELELLGHNVPGNFSIGRSCGSDRSLESYHMTVPQLRTCGPKHPYSLATTRDRSVIGTDLEQYACGIDIKFKPKQLRAFSIAAVELAQADPPYARGIREIIYSPDGKTVLRWDAERGMSSAPKPGEADNSHLWHTHFSAYRNAPAFKGTAELVIRALERAHLITAARMGELLTALYGAAPAPDPEPEEDDVNTDDVKLIQQRLNDATGAGLVVDGDFGAKTRAAVDALADKVALREQAAVDEAVKTTHDDVKAEAVAAVQAI